MMYLYLIYCISVAFALDIARVSSQGLEIIDVDNQTITVASTDTTLDCVALLSNSLIGISGREGYRLINDEIKKFPINGPFSGTSTGCYVDGEQLHVLTNTGRTYVISEDWDVVMTYGSTFSSTSYASSTGYTVSIIGNQILEFQGEITNSIFLDIDDLIVEALTVDESSSIMVVALDNSVGSSLYLVNEDDFLESIFISFEESTRDLQII